MESPKCTPSEHSLGFAPPFVHRRFMTGVRIMRLLRSNLYVLCVALLPLLGCTRAASLSLTPTVVALATSTSSRSASSPPSVLKIATYNIHHGVGEDDLLDIPRIARFVQPLDLAFLNEVDINWPRSQFSDQARLIAQEAGFEHYAFGPSLALPSVNLSPSRYGNAILSRHPIERAERLALPRPAGAEQRSALLVEIRLWDRPLTVIVTHLGLDADERLEQAKELVRIVQDVQTPVILAGDFNALPDSPEIQLIASVLTPTEELSSDPAGLTFPNPNPNSRIDYIFTSPDLAQHVVHHDVPQTSGSDHLPVVAHIAWRGFQ